MKEVAVVIGNNNYYDPDKLKNEANDAQAILKCENRYDARRTLAEKI